MNNLQKLKEEMEKGFSLTFKPKINPQLSCPQSVLHLPAVIDGIKKGEILIEVETEAYSRGYAKGASDRSALIFDINNRNVKT